MTHFLTNKAVSYVCACGLLNPLASLYFCRHCLNLRCGFCLCHEVDSHFCSSCLENIPSSEAKHKKYRCNSCFDCPSCQHTLSARGTTVVVAAGSASKKSTADGAPSESEAPKATRKMFYLSCLACRWTTRDVGIPDQTVATGSWPEPEYSNVTRFAQLMEYYQSVVLQEKQERQEFWRRKAPKQHKYPSLSDRTGVTVSMVRRQLGWSDKNAAPKLSMAEIKPSEATKVAESDLPEDIFTKEICLKRFTTVAQRLAQPAGQPYTVTHLFPQHKSLSIKKSLRCRQCEHNIIKPEFNPTSIKYRIQLFASYHVPEIRLMRSTVTTNNAQGSVQLKFINPTINDMTITIMELPTDEEELELIQEMKRCAVERTNKLPGATASSQNNSLNSSLTKQISLEDPRLVDRRVNSKLILPDSSFVLQHKDESAEFDDEVVHKGAKEEPK